MAVSGRIDDVILYQDGRVEVRFTEGPTPLEVGWSGQATIYSSRQDFFDALAATEADLMGKLKLLQLAKGYKLDPSLKSAFVTAVKDKTATLDLTGQVSTISVG